MAQLVERLPCTEEVGSSNLPGSTGFLEIQVTVFIRWFPAKGGSAFGGEPAWVHFKRLSTDLHQCCEKNKVKISKHIALIPLTDNF